LTVRYADTSSLVGAYFADEVRHLELRELLLEGDEQVVTSELARLELTSAVRAAARGGRIDDAGPVMDRFDADCGDRGPLALIRLVPERAFPEAHRLLVAHRLRSLDALHLSAALLLKRELVGVDDIVFVTEDRDQARAARAEGFELV
jgi:predicted nucleic acid-binding protein